MSAYAAVRQMRKMLSNLDAWLAHAETVANEAGYDPNNLLDQRLYPDMFPLRRQIEATCDVGKFTAGRLTGVKPPAHLDNRQSMSELRARLADVLEFMDSHDESAFDGADERLIPLPVAPGRGIVGADYLLQFSGPNFSFHLTMCYALLRANGVKLGKRMYLGELPIVELPVDVPE